VHPTRLLFVLFGLALGLGTFNARADEIFDYEVLRYKAKLLASKPYEVRAVRVPDFLLQPKLSYDEHRDIRFKPSESWWLREKLPFQLQFFHPGFIYNKTVQLHELRDRTERPIDFDKDFFNYGHTKLSGPIPGSMGFSGFRIHYALNNPNYLDELAVFQGASYFRALCEKAVYGLSARGLAIDTAEPSGEEFPVFEEFWIQRPLPDATEITVFALLDSPSVAGAYRFTIRPGKDTVVQVKTTLFLRRPVKVLGIAPLTSMFWHGESSSEHYSDFRPEVHDSDGLMVAHGGGEWLWRPLTNPKWIQSSAFADENPKGFGLVQRDRKFSNYEDLEAKYHLRPSTWVETVGNWGKGFVRLVELPTPDETNDNIVAFWQPEFLPAPGEPMEFEYRLHWFMDQIKPPSGFTVATRSGHSLTHEPDLQRFVVDFDSPYLHNQGDDPNIEAVISVGKGAKLIHQTIQKNQFNGTWRVAFALRADETKQPVELRCFLRKSPHILTETWSYRWNP
jgi:glucans biosynthesis protein